MRDQVYENYTSPLGVGFVCAGNHYDMDLPHRQRTTNATKLAVGFRRSDTYAIRYHNPTYLRLESCPESHLLYFHNVPYTRQLRSHNNMTVVQYIYLSHRTGAATAASFVQTWAQLAATLGSHPEYGLVASRLQAGATDAAMFSKAVIDYFA